MRENILRNGTAFRENSKQMRKIFSPVEAMRRSNRTSCDDGVDKS